MKRPQLKNPTPECPEILAPAGDESCFLAALAAGADNIYLGLKSFSARMQAENFSLTDLSRLTDLAHENGTRVTVAMNTLVKANEIESCARLIRRLETQVGCDGLIVQDLALLDIVRDAGFEGQVTLSTLANLTHPAALKLAKEMGASRVVLPRELSIDEIRMLGENCPDGLELECFVHGALCYCVSGRCYWSSYMGGKSGLRGRCVQPCRRVYSQGPGILPLLQRAERGQSGGRFDQKGRFDRNRSGQQRQSQLRLGRGQQDRYFSCQDLSLDVLTKTLTGIPHLVSWKIEGRKKGPHYVYHTVAAYKLLRDNPSDAQARKMADDFLEMALGRPTTHARFLPQREVVPVNPGGQTSSGLLVGKIGISPKGEVFIKPHMPLLVRDYLRIGTEDEKWHTTLPVSRSTPKAGTLILRVPKHKTPKAGVPVFLIDRREPELEKILADWRRRLQATEERRTENVNVRVSPVHKKQGTFKSIASMTVHASLPQGKETRGARAFQSCLWLTPRSADLSRTILKRFGWWLPPVVWPDEEKSMQRMIQHLWREGARVFVLNSPWQMGFFAEDMRADENARLIAGPFCNIANPYVIQSMQNMGFHAAIVSPELAGGDILSLPSQSPLPLGIVLQGAWPVGISRFGTLGVRLNEPFASPKGEIFWARQYGSNVWIYPAWSLDLTEKRQELEQAGYSFMVTIQERTPSGMPAMSRPGLFNWDNPLL